MDDDVFFFEAAEDLADVVFFFAAVFGVALLVVDLAPLEVLRDLADVDREAAPVAFFAVDFLAVPAFDLAVVFFADDFAPPEDVFLDAVVDFLAVDRAELAVFFLVDEPVVFFAAGFFAAAFLVVDFIADFLVPVDFFAAGFAFDFEAELFAVVFFFDVVLEAVFFLVVAMRSSLDQKVMNRV